MNIVRVCRRLYAICFYINILLWFTWTRVDTTLHELIVYLISWYCNCLRTLTEVFIHKTFSSLYLIQYHKSFKDFLFNSSIFLHSFAIENIHYTRLLSSFVKHRVFPTYRVQWIGMNHICCNHTAYMLFQLPLVDSNSRVWMESLCRIQHITKRLWNGKLIDSNKIINKKALDAKARIGWQI